MQVAITHRDPREQSDDELYDILAHIDRQTYQSRYKAIRDEYVRRHGELVNGQPLDDYFEKIRRKRPFGGRSRLKKRILLGLALFGLGMLVLRAAIFVSSNGR